MSFSDPDLPSSFAADEIDVNLLVELERQSRIEIQRLRKHERIELEIAVHLEPANSSQRGPVVEGRTADVSSGGLRAVFTSTVVVGDLYRLTFANSELELPTVFARCVRCFFVREDAFECGFKFFTPIVVPGVEPGERDDLLG